MLQHGGKMDPILDCRLTWRSTFKGKPAGKKKETNKERNSEVITYDSSLGNKLTPYHEKHLIWLKALEKV